MPETFAYKVRDKSGKLVEGQLEAENAQLVVSKLRSMGYVPIEIQQSGGIELEYRFGNWQTDIPLPGDLFRFQIPSGVAVIPGVSLPETPN